MTYDKIKFWYDNGIWTKEMVRSAVDKGRITKQQYRTITGEDY